MIYQMMNIMGYIGECDFHAARVCFNKINVIGIVRMARGCSVLCPLALELLISPSALYIDRVVCRGIYTTH